MTSRLLFLSLYLLFGTCLGACAQLVEPDLSTLDQDHDGFIDDLDAFPLDATEWKDSDHDGIGDNSDPDIDGDTCANSADAYPTNPLECLDTDGDGVGNNEDTDDDGDGLADVDDPDPLDPESNTDTDGDGTADASDNDDDNDGCLDSADDAPLDSNLCHDSDGDGVENDVDDFPNDATETTDNDSDSVGANTDCNDSNASVNPNRLEICGNSTDDDCNDSTDEIGCVISITGGTYNMGADADADGEGTLTSAMHDVAVSTFFLDKYEVTNALYGACVDDSGCTAPSALNSTFDNADFTDWPILYVSWNQANAYCEWAGKRLPTEAEWEYAARNGGRGQGLETTYPWGAAVPSSTLANFFDGTTLGTPQDVDQFSAGGSDSAIFNLEGNVSEWVSDFSGNYPATADALVTNPTGPASGLTTNKIFRGGNFTFIAGKLEGKDRFSADPATQSSTIGFRCASSSAVQN